MYSVMWSEHCSYKSSKVHLKQFSEIPQETPVGKMLAGIGENAGVLDIGQGYAVTFKVESHNHPSYVEPYQGAATGVGGIVRDILAMGARPVAVMDPLRFGPLDADDTHRVLPGIVAGVGGYGNMLGLPNIGGEAVFDASYPGNPLVNALCVGVLRHEDLHLAKASGAGNQVILYGARTGGDGIGGVSVLASETFDADGPGEAAERAGRRPLHGEAAHRVHPRDLRGRAGRRHPGPRRRRALLRDLRARVRRRRRHARRARPGPAARLHARARGDPDERVAGADDGGRRARRRRRRSWRSARSGTSRRSSSARSPTPAGCTSTGTASASSTCPRARSPTTARRTTAPSRARTGRTTCRPTPPRRWPARPPATSCARPCCSWSRSPNLCDKSWITDQYDRYVRGNTVLSQPSDSGMIRVDAETNLGVAISTDCNGRFAKLDPYAGAQLALAESYRNVATGGAAPLAISDCLNFGSPEDPAVMWQFAEACRGLKDACLELGIPVTGGNVSLYNQTGETAILPTPVVAVLGVIEDVTRRTPSAWSAGGERRLPARRDPRGAVRLRVGARRPRPPRRAAARGRPGGGAVAGRAAPATAVGLITSAHDLSDGGLAQALAEGALRHDVGVVGDGPGRRVPRRSSASRPPGCWSPSPTATPSGWSSWPRRHGVPITALGVTGGDALVVDGQFDVPLDELRAAWTATLPAALGLTGTSWDVTPGCNSDHGAVSPSSHRHAPSYPAVAARPRRARGR